MNNENETLKDLEVFAKWMRGKIITQELENLNDEETEAYFISLTHLDIEAYNYFVESTEEANKTFEELSDNWKNVSY